jgi:hypothetical protein
MNGLYQDRLQPESHLTAAVCIAFENQLLLLEATAIWLLTRLKLILFILPLVISIRTWPWVTLMVVVPLTTAAN